MTRQLLLCLLVPVLSANGSFNNDSNGNPQGLLIVGGGQGDGQATQLFTGEVFVPSLGKSCFLSQHLPDTRMSHTMDDDLLCGGLWIKSQDTQTTCLRFSTEDDSWTYSHTLDHKRVGHSSWVTSKGLLLMGGWLSDTTTELLSLEGGQGKPSFELEYRTKYACSIPDLDGHSVVLTGGGFDEEVSKVVTRYNKHGFVEDMPQLTVGRFDHACAAYQRDDGTQVMLVAGGLLHTGLHTGTTEVLVGNSRAWETVGPLPDLTEGREGYAGVKIAKLGNTLYLSGGYDGRYEYDMVLEWEASAEEWVRIGRMQKTRSFHSMAPVTVEGAMLDYCA